MNSSCSNPSDLKSQISSLFSGFSCAVRFWLVAVAGFISMEQMGLGQTTNAFTATGTWTCPTNVFSVQVEAWGGGGSGGTAVGQTGFRAAAGGGAGGAYVKSNRIAVTPGTVYTVTVGAGGVSVNSNGTATPGGDTWFSSSSTVLARGGAGANSLATSNADLTSPGGVGTAAGSIGDVKNAGGSGSAGFNPSGGGYAGGGGSSAGTSAAGNSAVNTATGATAPAGGGKGGNGRTTNGGNGTAGTAPGGAGGGAWAAAFTSVRAGGSGAAGKVVLTYVIVTEPEVESSTATSTTKTTATAGGSIIVGGGANATIRGVEYSKTDGFANGTGTQVPETGNFPEGAFTRSLSGLDAGTIYYFKAFATNRVGTSYGAQASFITLPDAPATPSASGVGPTGFTVNWGAVTGAASYRLDVATDATFTSLVSGYNDLSVAGTSQTVSGLIPTTTYYARVRAINATGGSGATSGTLTQATDAATSPTISVTGAPSARTATVGTPSASTSVAVSGSNLTADITATTPSTDFEVSSNDTVWGPTATFTESGGAASGTLYIRLSAAAPVSSPAGNVILSTTGATSQNVAVSGTVFKAEPTNHATGLAAGTITTTNIPAAWTAASPAPDGYLLKVSSSTVTDPVDGTDPVNVTDVSGGSAQVKIAPGSAASFSGFTGFAAGSTYTFALFPYNNSGTAINFKVASAPSFSAILLPAAPATPTFASVTATGFTVNWAAVTGATGYRLDVATDSGFTSIISGYSDLTVAGNSQAVTGLTANTAYHARVRAVNATGTSANSTTASQTTAQIPAPVAIAATNVAPTGFTANWNAVSGATGYCLDVYSGTPAVTAPDLFFSEYIEGSSNNKYIEIYNGTGATVSLSDYEVRLYNNGSSSAASTQNLGSLSAGPTTLANGATLVLRNSVAALTLPGGVTAYNSGVVNYNGDDALALYKLSTTSFIDYFGSVGNDPGSSWTDGESSTINKTLRRKTTVIAGLTTNPATTFPTLATEWDQFDIDTVSGLGTHTSDANGIAATTLLSGFDNLDVGNVTTYAVTGASAETEYIYVVRATSASSTSANSNEIDVTTDGFPAPTVVTGTAGSITRTTATIASNDVSSDGGSAITERGVVISTSANPTTADTKFTVAGTTGVFDADLTGLTANTEYYVRAFATNSSGTSYGTQGTFTTLDKATPTITLAPTATSIAYGQTLVSSTLSGGTASVAGTFAFTTPNTAPDAGTASQDVTFTPTDSGSYNTATTSASVTVNPTTLASETITITSNNGTYSASTASGSYPGGYTIRYSGRSGTVYGSSATAPSAPGLYTVTASPSDANYTGSNTQDYFIAGAVAVNDTVTRQVGSGSFKIPVATLLGNDSQVTADGQQLSTGLSISSLTSGTGNSVRVSGAFVFYTPSTPADSAPLTFTYVLSNGTATTAIGTVTVSTVAPTAFNLELLRLVSSTYDSVANTTAITVELAGVPGQNYTIQYSTNVSTWTSLPAPVSTGSTGTFNVSLTAPGNVTGTFFRATR